MAAVTGTITATPDTIDSGEESTLAVVLTGDSGLTVVQVINRMSPSTAGVFDELALLVGATGDSTTECTIRLNSGNTAAFDISTAIQVVMSDGQVVTPTPDTITVSPGPLPAAPG
jgi:hypothetical protein